VAVPIPSVNFHLVKTCNAQCRFCYAGFEHLDRPTQTMLPKPAALAVVDALAASFTKITFAGGEPTLCPWLPELCQAAKYLGMTTMVVTNGFRLDERRLDMLAPVCDWIALSIDSPYASTNAVIGRRRHGASPPDGAWYLDRVAAIRQREMRIKMNTVVTAANSGEDMTSFVSQIAPERWKILRMLPIAGENDHAADLLPDDASWRGFVKRHAAMTELGVTTVAEDNADMVGSYAMVDPMGCFFDNVTGRLRSGRSILEVGLQQAMSDVEIDAQTFAKRGGHYVWEN
jgi:radical S-adenosyl methionine domain-containing protein 2